MIKIASAPVSWGIYEFKDIEPRFPYATVLDQIAATGYTGIELGPYGYLPNEPAKLSVELNKRNLQLLSAFVPVNLVNPSTHEQGAQEALKVGKLLAALGARFIVLADDNGSVPELVKQAGRRKGSKLSADQWTMFAAGVDLIARRIHDDLGLQVAFHHHCGGYVETPDESRELLKRTNPELVGLCLDTGHWHYGGGNAVDCVREFGERVRYLHLKNYEPNIGAACRAAEKNYFEAIKDGVFCELGKGEVDFPGVIAEMQKHGYDGWAIVEQDILSDDPNAPKQFSQANRDYLRSIGL